MHCAVEPVLPTECACWRLGLTSVTLATQAAKALLFLFSLCFTLQARFAVAAGPRVKYQAAAAPATMAKAADRRRPKRGAAAVASGKPKRRKANDDLPEDGSKDEFFVDEAAQPGGTDSEPDADAEEAETAEAKRLRLGAAACLVFCQHVCRRARSAQLRGFVFPAGVSAGKERATALQDGGYCCGTD